MDLMTRRRALLGQAEEDPTVYVMDGLVLWLDGINKGDTENAWVDLINGYIFQANSNVFFGSNYVELFGSSTSSLSNDNFIPPSVVNGTIEVVVSDYSTASTNLLFMPKNSGIALGFYNKTVLWSADTANYMRCVVIPDGAKIISICEDRAIADLNEATFNNDARVWTGQSGTNFIGKRGNSNYFTGKIHAIRIYNRILSQIEMMQNQRLDNQRFNFGL